jgi:hypothetical protein
MMWGRMVSCGRLAIGLARFVRLQDTNLPHRLRIVA